MAPTTPARLRCLPCRRHRAWAAVALALPGAVMAQAAPGRPPGVPAPPIVLEAQEIRGRPDLETVAEGAVEFRRGELSLFADRLSYEQAEDLATARGHVRIVRPDSVYSGPELQLRVQRFEGFFLAPRFELLARGTSGRASRVDFLDRSRSVALDAEYTSCPREDDGGRAVQPAWLLTADRVKLDVEANEGVAEGGVLRFLGVPILAAPTLSFPLSDERKSGWLPPTLNLDNRSGFEVTVPYYWNIAPQRDATVAPRVITRRGVGLQGEFRYLEPSFDGEVAADWLPRDRLAGRSRHALSLRHEGLAPLGLRYRAEGVRVSDDDWWKDFPRAGRALTPRLLPLAASAERPSVWSGGQALAYARVQRWQLLQTDEAIITAPYNRAPQVGAQADLRGPAGLEFSALGEFNRFTLAEQPEVAINPLPTGSRWHAVAAVARPWRAPGWWVVPRLRVLHARYDIDNPLPDGQPQVSRTIPTFSVDSGLLFERHARILGRDVQQTLEPRLLYVRTPWRDPAGLPNFDSAGRDVDFGSVFSESDFTGVDRVSDANHLTAGVTTRLYDAGSGAELLRLGVAQRVLFSDQRITPEGTVNTQRFSDVLLLGSSRLARRWTLDGSLQYSAELGRPVRSVLSARYSPGPYRTLAASYRFARASAERPESGSEQAEIGWQWPILLQRPDSPARRAVDGAAGGRHVSAKGAGNCRGDWYSVGRINYSLRDSRITDSLVGFEYDAGCWIGRVVAERLSTGRSEATTRLMVQLELVGLSRLGTNPLQSLKDNIPGYRLLREERGGVTENSIP